MGRLKVRGPDTREFEIDASALPFWQGRVEVVSEIPEPGDEPATDAGEADDPSAVAADSQPGKSKAAARPVPEVKE